jgi:hypothetical protein
MPTPMTYSRNHARLFSTKDDAEMFLVKKIRQYPGAKFIRSLRARRIKLFVIEKPNGKFKVDYWHPLHREKR